MLSNLHCLKHSANSHSVVLCLYIPSFVFWNLRAICLFSFLWFNKAANINYTKDCLVSASLQLKWCTQGRSEVGRELTSQHRISNYSDIVHAIGPHLYVQVKEQFGWRWTRRESNILNPSVHLSDLFSSQFMACLYVEVPGLPQKPLKEEKCFNTHLGNEGSTHPTPQRSKVEFNF